MMINSLPLVGLVRSVLLSFPQYQVGCRPLDLTSADDRSKNDRSSRVPKGDRGSGRGLNSIIEAVDRAVHVEVLRLANETNKFSIQ